MLRYVLVLALMLGAAAMLSPGACVAGCGKDCAKNNAGQPQATGCRVLYSSGILYDNGIAIAVSAPDGWVIDDESGVSAGLHAVFYPKGSSWQGSDTVMYAQISHKSDCKSATIEKVMTLDACEPMDFKLDVKVKNGGVLKTTKGKDAVVRLFSGAVNQAVAYIDEEKAVVRLVLSSKTKKGLKEAMPAFKEFVGTYLFVSDDVDVNRNCTSGPGMSQADRPAGSKFKVKVAAGAVKHHTISKLPKPCVAVQ
jgi:hypothetical protein